MSNVDLLRERQISDKAVDRLRSLLQEQVDSMKPLTLAEERLARQGLTAMYVSVAKGLHAQEMGQLAEALMQKSETETKFLEMRKSLEH